MLNEREGAALSGIENAVASTTPAPCAGHVPVPPQAPTGTVLAFDFGAKFTGVAVGESKLRVAHPLGLISTESKTVRMDEIATLVTEWKPAFLVVGLPFSMDGREHELTRRCRRFARQLGLRFGLPVILVDERFSSTAAEEALRAAGKGGRTHKLRTHQVSAQIILQSYFDDPGTPRS